MNRELALRHRKSSSSSTYTRNNRAEMRRVYIFIGPGPCLPQLAISCQAIASSLGSLRLFFFSPQQLFYAYIYFPKCVTKLLSHSQVTHIRIYYLHGDCGCGGFSLGGRVRKREYAHNAQTAYVYRNRAIPKAVQIHRQDRVNKRIYAASRWYSVFVHTYLYRTT